jgi:hypothetical protein
VTLAQFFRILQRENGENVIFIEKSVEWRVGIMEGHGRDMVEHGRDMEIMDDGDDMDTVEGGNGS